MHTSVIRSPQAMSNDQSYRPRSPKLPGFNESQQQIPRLTRLPSYQIEEPNLPRGYSFSPRGSYDASPFFSQPLQQASNPQSGAQQANTFLPQSPPRLTSASLPDQLHAFSPISYVESPRQQQISSPFQQSPQQLTQHHYSQSNNYPPQFDDMARLRSRKPVNYNEDHNGAQYEEPVATYPPPQPTHHMPHTQQMPLMPQQPQQFAQHQPPSHQFMQQPNPFNQPFQTPAQVPAAPPVPPMPQIDVRTKFPVARIKRIMQADEDVGKVAQATPTAVSKALELFMIALVTKGAAEANKNNSKRVTATHLKHALLTDPQFDFLNEICEAVPDEGGKGSKGRAKSEAKSEDSDEDMGAAPKKRARAGKKKKGGDDEGSD